MRRIGAGIEFSATTIYLYFRDKEAVVRALCEQELAALGHAVRQAVLVADPVERLRKVATLYVDYGLEHPNYYRAIFRQTHRSPDIAETKPGDPKRPPRPPAPHRHEKSLSAEDGNVHPYQFIRLVVFKAMAAGCFKAEYKDVDLLAQSLWSGLHGIILLHLSRAHHPEVPWRPAHTALDHFLETWWNGNAAGKHQHPSSWRQ